MRCQRRPKPEKAFIDFLVDIVFAIVSHINAAWLMKLDMTGDYMQNIAA